MNDHLSFKQSGETRRLLALRDQDLQAHNTFNAPFTAVFLFDKEGYVREWAKERPSDRKRKRRNEQKKEKRNERTNKL